MDSLKLYFTNFRLRKRLLAMADAFIVVVAGLIANFPLPLFADRIGRPDLFNIFALSLVCCFAGLMLFGAYNKLWRYFSKRDYLCCVKGCVLGLSVAYVLFFLTTGLIFVAFFTMHLLFTIIGVCLFRFVFRDAFMTLVKTGMDDAKRRRCLIIGAGRSTQMILKEIRKAGEDAAKKDGVSNSVHFINPVCIVDDDRSVIGKNVDGVLVVGGTADIPKIAKLERIEQIIFSIPSCPPADRQKILDICSHTGLPVKIVPFLGSLIDGGGDGHLVSQLRDIKVEDLLGRAPITFDNKDIRNFIEGKICMVTGGGGSIGSELVRQIAKYKPAQVIIVDIYENNAYEIQQEIVMEYGPEFNLMTLIASVRDYDRMAQIFKKYKPEVVFHAAAHKHVPLMEVSPMEAIKNNVVGTFNVGSLSMQNGVKKFVMISTDKAVNPTNVMGASKRCCEMIIQYFSQHEDCNTEFVTTRFGNVLGSNGSVIPLFKRQIEQGKPVTVTHPDIIRYFMTIPEAVSLVMEAASIAHGGEIFVLDMGQPVKIVTLAENLIRMYGKVPYKDVEIKFTGLRPGEKILEELLMNEEGLQKTRNKLIYIGRQIEINKELFINQLHSLKNAAEENNEMLAISALHHIVPTFVTPEEFNKTVLMPAIEK
ncbi:polysaccharide biosynthesis protein [Fibrobacter sp.]|uniref:polysaccharide biosynthesis protein n=1 Tax=Fibrobacter sp. TaxID=35828 RepID=UPI00388D97ED